MLPRLRSITPLVAGVLVIVTTALLGIFFVLLYVSDWRSQMEYIRQDLILTTDQATAALALPVWNIDTDQVNKILDSVMNDQSVYAIVLGAGPGGRDIKKLARVRDAQWHPTQTDHDISADGMLVEQRDVYAADGEDIGTLKVYVTPGFTQQKLRRKLAVQASFIVLLDIAVVASLYGMLWFIVLRPLREVEQFALSVPGGNAKATIIGVFGGDEIHRLRRSIQRMVEQLETQLKAMQANEGQIRQLNADLEQRVLDRTAALEAANRELEAFSYSVSHDLRAPLRAIAGFSEILQEDYAGKLAPDATRCLKVIADSTVQMGRLIDDLLALSRLSRLPLKKELVSIGRMLEGIVAELRATEPAGRQIDVHIESLPPCQADPALLRSALTNLVSNALKYTRKQKDAIIEIGFRPSSTPGSCTYFVKDNGAGFDMRYVGKLFGVFQRLHRAEDFEGTGVGLAIVQRIISRHGGRVWAEGAVDQGATFFFSLETQTV